MSLYFFTVSFCWHLVTCLYKCLECVKLPWIRISNHSLLGAGVVAAYYRYLDIYSATSHVIVIISATLWPRRGDESRWTPAPHHACSPVCACAVPGHYVAARILLQTNYFVFTPQFISSLNINTYKYNVCLWYVKCEGDKLFKSFSWFTSKFFTIFGGRCRERERTKCMFHPRSPRAHIISLTGDCRAVVGVVRVRLL